MAQQGRGLGARVALIGFILGIAAAGAAILIGVANRFEIITYRDGFHMLPWIVYGGIAAAAVSLLGAATTWKSARGFMVLALVGLVLGGLTAWIPYHTRQALRAAPKLNDVTTDTEHPPAFVAALAQRKESHATNSTDYNAKNAAVQHKYYPDIKPVMMPVPPEEAFARARAAIKALRWKLIAADKAAGRIEAYDTTFWFGFKDDVVIRVAAAPGGSRVDIRSESRVGGREAGTNAQRVRRLSKLLQGRS